MSGDEYSEQVGDAWHSLGCPTLNEILVGATTGAWGQPPARCDECGRFTKASELVLVYGPGLDDGPDHEACVRCRARTCEEIKRLLADGAT